MDLLVDDLGGDLRVTSNNRVDLEIFCRLAINFRNVSIEFDRFHAAVVAVRLTDFNEFFVMFIGDAINPLVHSNSTHNMSNTNGNTRR